MPVRQDSTLSASWSSGVPGADQGRTKEALRYRCAVPSATVRLPEAVQDDTGCCLGYSAVRSWYVGSEKSAGGA